MISTAVRRAILPALLTATMTACSSPGAPPAAPGASAGAEGGDAVRRSPVVPGRRARVFVMAGFGEKCESLESPAITVIRPPAKGSVSFEPGQETMINSSATGSCIGQRVRGTGIYYTAREGETGADTFTVEASLDGSVTQRTFTVEIAP